MRSLAVAVLLVLFGSICEAAAINLKDYPDRRDVAVTAYATIPSCTKRYGDPTVTASMLRLKKKHHKKIIALSRDLAKNFRFGAQFWLLVDERIFVVEYQDRMNVRHRAKIDLLMGSKEECLKFGKKKGVLIPVNQDWE